MITILPRKQNKNEDQLLRVPQDAESNSEVLVLCDGDRELGYITVDVKSSTVRIQKLTLTETVANSEQGTFYVDSLIRAAASFAMNVGAYQLESLIPDWQECFRTVGFETIAGRIICPLSAICHNCSHFAG